MARCRRPKINPPRRLKLRPTPEFLRRFLSHVEFDKSTGCWNWTASTDANGYGQCKAAGQCRGAHRVSYAVFIRTIPDNREIDHDCGNHACVNPHHLIAKHPLANASAGGGRRRSHAQADDGGELPPF